MDRFLAQHADGILGVLQGFDRVRFRGTLPSVCNLQCLLGFLGARKVRYTDFGKFVRRLSDQVKAHAQKYAEEQGRPFIYLGRRCLDKTALARETQQRDGISSGLIAVFSCVEWCSSYRVTGEPAKRHIQIVPATRLCLYLYFYFEHPEFGLMHVRLQTWLPYTITVCLNGREYLAKQLDRAGIAYAKKTNGFTSIADLPRAQALLDQLTTYPWDKFLNDLIHPLHALLHEPRWGFDRHGYYWTMCESEYATDLLFRDAAALGAFYPKLVAYALERLHAPDILRFLGRTTVFTGEVAMDVRRRTEGVCVKHRAGKNSVKMYLDQLVADCSRAGVDYTSGMDRQAS